jgi:uncharacterized LabA/DUF88 family protein
MQAVVIVDGLNLYHALHNFEPEATFLDIPSLAAVYLPKPRQEVRYFYFTSTPHHKGQAAIERHFKYLALLKSENVEIIEGRFQRSSKRCSNCGDKAEIHKEKETDVSIALKIIESALDPTTLEILLFSADSDFAPALKFAKKLNPNVRLMVAQTSSFLRLSPNSLGASADSVVRLKSELIHNFQFRS